MKYALIGIVFVSIVLTAFFTFQGTNYFVLFDDEMISMYYAKNFLSGIEGYSNPLWTVIMIPCQLLPKSIASLPIVLINLACIFGMMKLSKHPILLGLTFPLLFWAVRGVEFIPIAYLLFYGLKTNKVIIPIILITLLRIDGFVFSFILLISQFNTKNLIVYAGTLLMFFGIRFIHYGDLLSNTYYLKMGYPLLNRVERSFQWQNIIYLLTPYKYAIPITLIFLYNMFIGGDAWEQYGFVNRFLLVTVPLFYETDFKELLIYKLYEPNSRNVKAKNV